MEPPGISHLPGHGVDIACLTSPSIDDSGRPLAVCLHGYPDSATTWRHLVPELEAAGYRVATPYLRGYAPSGVPADGLVQSGASSMDAIAVHDHFRGDERAVVIGHDWGAPIAYGAAGFAPDRWSKVVGMAVPPGPALATGLLSDLSQLKRSWYMFVILQPFAELVVPANDLAFVDMLWADWSPGHDHPDDVERHKRCVRDPANLAAALGYYRAALGDGPTDPALSEVQQAVQAEPPQPTLYLHGEDDGCVGASVARTADATTSDNITVEIVPGTGHFLHLDDPPTVNQHILEFVT